MITKTFAPKTGAKVFVIMEVFGHGMAAPYRRYSLPFRMSVRAARMSATSVRAV